MVLVVSAALLFAAAQLSVTPKLQARFEVSRLEPRSRATPLLRHQEHDRPTYDRIMSELREGLLQGRSQAELIERVRVEMVSIVQKRLPRASDEAATQYMRVMVQEMTELRQQGGDLCYRFLFAQPGQSLDLTRHVSANTMEADFEALSQVVRTSIVSPQPAPQQAEVAPRLEPVVAALAGRYGRDLALLQQPQAPGIDRDKLCAISIDMYSVILQLPIAESGKLIRYLLGQG